MSANIFIVEDEKSIVTLLKYNLEIKGYKVNFAETGEEAIQNIKKDIPDLIILDWMLPDFSGIEVCRQIKKINKKNLEISTHLLFAAKHIERIGDHVTNISENVYFLVTGDQIKGTRSKKVDKSLET